MHPAQQRQPAGDLRAEVRNLHARIATLTAERDAARQELATRADGGFAPRPTAALDESRRLLAAHRRKIAGN